MLVHEEEENGRNGSGRDYRSGYALPFIIQQQRRSKLTQELDMMNPPSINSTPSNTVDTASANHSPSNTNSASRISPKELDPRPTTSSRYYYGRILSSSTTADTAGTTRTSTPTENDAVREKLQIYLQRTALAISELQGKIYKMEESYHDDTHAHGNIYRGLEPLLDCKLGTSTTIPSNTTGVSTITSTSSGTLTNEVSCLTPATSAIGTSIANTSSAFISAIADTNTNNTGSGIKRRMALDDRWFSSSCGIQPHTSANYNPTSSAANLGNTKTKRGRATTAANITSSNPSHLYMSNTGTSTTILTSTTTAATSTNRQAWALSNTGIHGTTTVSFGPQLIPTDESTPTNDTSTITTPLDVDATQSASPSTQNLPTRASDIQNSNQK